jgi:hypothetical protein
MTFCLTVFHGSSWSNSWNTIMRSGPGRSMARPFKRMLPSTGVKKPPTPLSKVDLPQPDGPSRMKRSPRWTSNPTR